MKSFILNKEHVHSHAMPVIFKHVGKQNIKIYEEYVVLHFNDNDERIVNALIDVEVYPFLKENKFQF